MIKAGELAAMTALELALTDRYAGHIREKKLLNAAEIEDEAERQERVDEIQTRKPP